MEKKETITAERLRKRLLTLLILLGACFAQADEFKIHLLSPWLNDPARADKIPHFLSNEIGPGHPGAPMKATGDGWYEYTWVTPKTPEAHVTFFFQSYIPNANYAYDQAQQYVNGGQNFRFGDTFLAWDVKEIWIIPQGPGKPPIVTDIPQVKKVAYLYNPWPVSAPMSRTTAAGVWNLMRPSRDKARCGWYLHHFTGPELTLAFKSLIGNQMYGTTGLGGTQALDLTTALATADTVFLAPDPIPGGPPKIMTRFPEGLTGTCSFPLAVTIRDFSKNHPDFEKGRAMGDAVIKNMVLPTLPADKKPVKGPNPHTYQSRFEDWFRTQSSQGNPDWNNYETCKDLPLSKNAKGYWAYDSYLEESHGYFPIDDFNKFNQTFQSNYKERGTDQWKETKGLHNFHFCMEMHAQFEYKPGQVFKFEGDDDVWVYIDNKLAIDLGGAHQAASDTVNLDKLGLTEGKKYDFDMFYCERQTTSSNLLLQTSIYFEQEQSVFAKKTPVGDKAQYDIFEIISGDKSCGATKGGDTVIATSIFKLSGPSVNPAEVLPVGLSHGGITINASKTQVTVDTSKVTGLRPGIYTVTFTSERSGKGGYIQFTVSGRVAVDLVDKREGVPAYTGDISAVSIQTSWNGAPDPRPDTVTLKPQAGLKVYADSAKTQEIAPNTPFVLPPNGNKRVYVTADAPGTYTLELLGGKGQAISMDQETFSFEKQLKVTLTPTPVPGNFMVSPHAVTLTANPAGAAIYYTLDGSDPTTSPTRQTYAGPISLTATTTIKAYGTFTGMVDSDVLTAVYTYTPPAKVVSAAYKDKDGDGRIETVVILFDRDLAAAPAKLAFSISDPKGANETRQAAGAEISQSGSLTTVNLANPFPFGVTALTNGPVSGSLFDQPALPLLAGTFAIADSVAPVILKAETQEPDSANPYKRILFEVSENMDLSLTSPTALVFKRGDNEIPSAQLTLLPTVKTGERTYAAVIDTSSAVYPIVGDSLALGTTGDAKDVPGNVPGRKFFVRINGVVPKAKPMEIYVTFPNGSREAASAGTIPHGPARFIPVDSRGSPLPGIPRDGKCPGCPAMDGNSFAGPVFHLVTAGPMEYSFRIFTNTGEFVATAKGRIAEEDLPLLQKKNDASGVRYIARIVWTGTSADGRPAGTGAYVLLANMVSPKDLKTGAGPGSQNGKITFGLLRGL